MFTDTIPLIYKPEFILFGRFIYNHHPSRTTQDANLVELVIQHGQTGTLPTLDYTLLKGACVYFFLLPGFQILRKDLRTAQ